MAKRLVILNFTPETGSAPIIHNIGQQFNLITNIRRANFTEDRGWIEIEFEGAEKDIEDGTVWAISRGVRVEPVNDETA